MAAAKELKRKDNAEYMYDMIGVICAPTNADYLKDIRQMWADIRDDSVPEFKVDKVTYDGGTPTIPWKQATEIMFSQLAVMKRLKGG